MAYDEYLEERIIQSLQNKKVVFEAKKMMGGLTFMVNGKMCVGIIKNELLARIGEGQMEKALKIPGCRPMDFTGKPMKAYVLVSPLAIDSDADLDDWIGKSLNFIQTL